MHMETAKQSSGRYMYMDVLRILATFTVIILHVNPQAHLEVPVSSAGWIMMTVLSALCAWNVPVFFMISGALFLSPQKELSTKRLYGKTLARMVVSFGIWSGFYALVYCFLRNKGMWTFLNQLFRGHYHMWYVFSIISLYWITPLLRRITESRKATEYLLLTGLVFGCLASRVLGFIQLFDLPHSDVVQSVQSAYAQMNPYRSLMPVFYFVLGHYLHTYPLGRRARRLLYAAGVAGLIATAGLSVWLSNMRGATDSYFFSHGSLNLVFWSASVFVFGREVVENFRNEGKAERIIVGLSKCSFGVYLAHAFFIERLNYSFHTSAGILFAEILLVSCTVYVLSFALSWILNRLPVLNKWIV